MLWPMGWPDGFDGYGAMAWMFFGPLMMLIFVAACIAVMYLVMRSASPARSRASGAVEILMERYARGEIDQQEFEERRRILGA
jgi:putative membrane protein